jgi:hypothetical protein
MLKDVANLYDLTREIRQFDEFTPTLSCRNRSVIIDLLNLRTAE